MRTMQPWLKEKIMTGDLYKSLRVALKVSIKELSDKLGISEKYISMLEAEKRPVSELQSRKMIKLFENTTEEILSKDELYKKAMNI